MSKSFLATASVALLLLGACGKPSASAPVTVGGAAMVQEKTIVENAANANNLKTLVAAVRAAKLEATLAGPGPYTVFAPTDAAFAALPDGALQALLRPENADLLTQLLTYHVVPGKLVAANLSNGMRLRTTEGKELAIAKDAKGMVTVNGVVVSITDVPASNGVVHVIDGVLLPPVGDTAVQPNTAVSSSADAMVKPVTTSTASSSAQVQPPSTGQGGVAGVTMDKGVLYRVFDNGSREQMRTDMKLANGITVMTDGKVLSPDGRTAMMKDGQLLTINGDIGDASKGLPTSSAAVVAPQAAGPAYGVYTEGVVGNGKTSLLFFHASWCPECKAADAKLAQIYSGGTAKISTYRVDYDTSAPLKQKYGVTTQTSFVLIDGTGKALKTVIAPNEGALLALVQS